MSLSFRLRRRKTVRLATTAVLGVLFGLPLAAAQPAQAAQESGDAHVTFSGGGLGLLLCGSHPDVAQIRVGAESKVRLTNGLGLAATLTIDGAASAPVASGETVEVQFHRGPVTIGMEPDCALNLNRSFEQLTVEVTPARAVPEPVRTGSGDQPSSRPSMTSPASGEDGEPDDGGAPPPPEDPLFSGMSDLQTDSSAVASGGSLESPATVVNPDGSPATRVASMTGPADKGPIGLLAIIATVCVVGVSIGAIRAIITQRASRAEFA